MTIEQLNLDPEWVPETVLDVGAFRGDFALSALGVWHSARVLSFEPLEKRPRRWQGFKSRWEWYPVALGAVAGRGHIGRNEFIPSSSMLPMLDLHRDAFPYTRKVEWVEVGVAMLDEFEPKIEGPALLKIDVQGFELEVLKGASEVLTMTSVVVCEVSHDDLYEGAPDFEEIDSLLVEAGFTYSTVVDELRHPADSEHILQTDEMWVRA